MNIKIIFENPPLQLAELQINGNEKIIVIKDPYAIAMVGWGREIKAPDGSSISYEQYCAELEGIITSTIQSQKLHTNTRCESITVQGCKEPPIFKAVNQALVEANISFLSTCRLEYQDCAFGGAAYVNSALKLVNAAQKSDEPVEFKLYIDDSSGKSRLSAHDVAKLAASNNVVFFQDRDAAPAVRGFTDDQTIGVKPSILTNPSHFYRTEINSTNPQQAMLSRFFSQAHQQQNDYTCGPATLRMVIDYYTALDQRSFCGQPVPPQNKEAFKTLNNASEMEMAALVGTNEAEGSEIADIRDGLMKHKLTVIDSSEGFTTDACTAQELKSHKAVLWDKIQQVLKLGIPVILNLQDRKDGFGHYEVAIGIDDKNNIILADPGMALDGKVEFETVPKHPFIERWKNHNADRHGRFLIIPPNEASAQKIEKIMEDVPHFYNGEARGKDNRAPRL